VDQQAFLPPVIAAEGLYAACWLEKEAKNSSMLGGMAAGEKIPAVEGAAGAMRAASGAWRSPAISVRGGRSMCCADDCGSGGGVGLAGWGISGMFDEDLLCWAA